MPGPLVDDDAVRRLAALARLRVPESEVAALRRDLEHILEYVGRLQDVTGPVAERVELDPAPRPPAERADVPGPGCRRSDVLAGAPDVREGFVVTPGLDRGGP